MSTEYNVLILGPKGSGKTVFLSSMYHQLSIPDANNFYLDTVNDQQGRSLMNLFSNLPKSWPQPSRDTVIEEWKFRCMLKSGADSFEAFRITYFDYSGGRLTNDSDDQNKMKDVINKADIVLGMIDGLQLLRVMEVQDFTSDFYLVYLESVLKRLSIAHKENQIVHILITKWDLLKDKYTVQEIKQRLLEYDRFKKFALQVVGDNKKEIGGKIRFMPISSVGFNFAQLDEDGINMNIKPNAQLNPYNVEMPLSLAFIDPIKKSIEEMAIKEMELKKTTIHVEPDLEWWEWLIRGVGQVVSGASQVLGMVSQKLGISIPILKHIADLAGSYGEDNIIEAQQKEQRLREELKNKINKIYNVQGAAEFVLTSFLLNESLLAGEHPGSVIDKKTFKEKTI